MCCLVLFWRMELSKDYIASKGFYHHSEHLSSLIFKSHKTYRGLSSGDDKKLIVDWETGKGSTEIYWLFNNGFEATIFFGVLKTGDDFDSILKLLEI